MIATLHQTPARIQDLETMADQLRRDSLIATTAAGSGHPTSCLSCAELLSVLFFHHLRFDLAHPELPSNDRFILSKGHAAPILWALFAESGAIEREELDRLRTLESPLEGHPTPRSRLVDVATGSLGQGLSAGLGMARVSQMERLSNRIYVLLGDGETVEGSVWEAAALASHYGLHQLTAMIDVNRLGQSEPTMYGHDIGVYADRFQAFGWHVEIVDGHDVRAVSRAYELAAEETQRPTAIVAETVKGKGVSFLEDAEDRHGKPVTQEELSRALEELEAHAFNGNLEVRLPDQRFSDRVEPVQEPPELPEYEVGEPVATRDGYGSGLRKVGAADPRVVSLDGEVKNSTRSAEFERAFPERFTQCFIAEQNMVGMALGMSAVGKVPFVSSFASFLTRAGDQIRMAGISRANVKFCGSHAGVSIGEDGPSQMGLEDLALFRAVPGSMVFHPADAVCMEHAVRLAAEAEGIVYLRALRPKVPVLYDASHPFRPGKGIVVRSSGEDQATVVACGITVHEALAAAELLSDEQLSVRVIDCWSIKPIDRELLLEAVEQTGVILTVEDHYPEGGLGEAVAGALAGATWQGRHLAVSGVPRSGSSRELLARSGIDREAIAAALRELLRH